MAKERRTFGAKDRARLAELHAEGLSLNECARRLGWSPSTISVHSVKMDLSWDRALTREATEARVIDLAAVRARLAEKFAEAAEHLLDQIYEPALVFNFGGKDNTYEEHKLPKPPVQDIRGLVQAAGTASTKSMELSKFTASAGDTGAVGEFLEWLEHGDELEPDPEDMFDGASDDPSLDPFDDPSDESSGDLSDGPSDE